jgi:membrane protein required for colicin V production
MVSVVIGFRKGFINSLTVIFGFVLGIYIAAQRYSVLEKLLFKNLNHPSFRVVSFIIIFVVVFLLVVILGQLLKKVIKLILLEWLDKLLGAVFGLVQGLIVIWLLLLITMTAAPRTKEIINKSYLAPKIFEHGVRLSRLRLYERPKFSPPKRSKKVLTDKVNYCKIELMIINDSQFLKGGVV